MRDAYTIVVGYSHFQAKQVHINFKRQL